MRSEVQVFPDPPIQDKVCIGNKYDSKLDDEAYLEDVMNKTKLSQIDLLIDNNTYFEIKWLGQK